MRSASSSNSPGTPEMADQPPVFDGLVTFFASHHAMRAEKVLKKNGLRVALVPGPREISPNCGVAMQFEYCCREQVRDVLAQNKVQIEAIHHYQIEMSAEGMDKFRTGRRTADTDVSSDRARS